MTSRLRRHSSINIWPGFVDALATLLIIILFLLMVFTLAQFFLGETLSGRNEALKKLNTQVGELAQMLSLERQSNEDLRTTLTQLSAQLQQSVSAREQLGAALASVQAEREALAQKLADANKIVAADKEKITLQLREIASIRQDIAALREVRADLESKVAKLAATNVRQSADLTSLRDRSKVLETRLSSAEERTALAQKEAGSKTIALEAAQKNVILLNDQIAALRSQLSRISTALEAAEIKVRDQKDQIVNLGKRLNLALVSKVEELAKFRSEFFGRLRDVLGARKDIRVVGDRFVLQSELLFDSGSATLKQAGRIQVGQLATALNEIAAKIPSDLDWVLRVDGHTDRLPIRTAAFPSNWELSTARAISVVKYLQAQGIPARRLAATGFAQHRPIDPREDEIAFRRNRRIELKFTRQ